MLSAAGKHYGEGIIKKYSVQLINELNKKYNETNLKRMRQLYYIVEKGATLWHQLSWSHYRLLIPLKSIEEINYYSKVAYEKVYSVRQLELCIKNREYERLSDAAKNKLILREKIEIHDLIKSPIIIKSNSNYKIISEKILQKLILEDIPSFLKELGDVFTFIDNEYQIKIVIIT